MSRADPKPGRWILPLVVTGIIGFTYTFVNALPAAEVPSATTTTLDASGSSTTTASTSSTTTTTLPPEAVAFIEAVDGFSVDATALLEVAQQLNEDWEARTVGFSDIRSGLGDLRGSMSAFVEALSTAEFPDDAAALWTDAVEAAAAMNEAADAMLDGLVNTEGSERRLAALGDFNAAETSLQQALSAAAEVVSG